MMSNLLVAERQLAALLMAVGSLADARRKEVGKCFISPLWTH